MKKKRTYGSVDVEKIDITSLVQLVLTVGCIVAVDVAKTKFVAALANAAGEVLRILRFEHPRQTLAFLRIVDALKDACCLSRYSPGSAPRSIVRSRGRSLGLRARLRRHRRFRQSERPEHRA